MVRQLIIVLAVVPASACDGDSYDDCSGSQVEKKLTVETPADPPLQLKVDSCRVDVDACPALCAMAMERTQIHYTPDSCDVGFAGDTVIMKVAYTSYGQGCFFGDDTIAVPPSGF